jgi:hypothetical protein
MRATLKTRARLSAAVFIAATGAAFVLAAPAQALKFDWEYGGDVDCINAADQTSTWIPGLAKSTFFGCEETKHKRIACRDSGDASNGYESRPPRCDTSLALNP